MEASFAEEFLEPREIGKEIQAGFPILDQKDTRNLLEWKEDPFDSCMGEFMEGIRSSVRACLIQWAVLYYGSLISNIIN